MKDVRRGDVFELLDGYGEVQSVVANNEGGYDLVVRYSEMREDLSTNVLRAGGPDEREDDKDNRPEEVHEERAKAEVEAESDEESEDE